MGTENTPETPRRLQVIAIIVGIVAGAFGIVQVLTQQPIVALFAAIIGAVIASIYFTQRGYVFETIVAWLAAIVIGLAIFVLFPRSGTVAGIVYDAERNPISNEEVILNDATGVDRKAKTDAQGYYEFKGVPAGKFEVKVRDNISGGVISNLFGKEISDIYTNATSLAQIPHIGPSKTPTLPTSTDTPVLTGTATLTPSPLPLTDTPTSTPTPHIIFEFEECLRSGTPLPAKTPIPANTIIKCQGSYSGIDPANAWIWIVLRDDSGNYFLQSPHVDLGPEGRWEASSVRPGRGITRILAVKVTQEGHRTFLRKVENEEFDAFLELPEGSETLATVDITTQ